MPPRFFWYEDEVFCVREDEEGGVISEALRDGSWVRAGNVAELDFKGRPISEEEIPGYVKAIGSVGVPGAPGS